MKRFLLSLLLLAGAFSAHAQIDVTWGVPLKNPRKTAPSDILGADKEYFYVIRSSYKLFSGGMTIEKYKREDMSFVSSTPVKLEDATKHDLEYEGLSFVGGKMLLFTSQYNRETDKRTAYLQTISSDGTTGPAKAIDEISAKKRSNSGSYSFVLSNDSSKVLMIRNEPFEKYANEKFTFKVFDNGMNLLWEKALELPYKDKSFSLNNYTVDNDGNVYMLASIAKDLAGTTRKERRTKPQYYYNILFYDHTADALKEYVVDLGDKYISDITFTIDTAKGDMVCAGFYSNKASYALIGTFYMKISKDTKTVVAKGTKDFDKDFLQQFMSAKKASKNQELYNYDLRDLLLRPDGSATLIAEQFYIMEVCHTDPKTGTTTCTYHYYYNDIIVVSIKPDGTVAWSKKIPKYQHSVNDGGYFSSFALSVTDNRLYFMYNDNPKSEKLPLEATAPASGGKAAPTCKPLNSPKKAVAMLVTVDNNGNMDRQVMFSNKDLKIILRPKIALQVEPTHTFLYGVKGSTYKFADVKLN